MVTPMPSPMLPDDLRDLCLALPQATETFPFGEDLSVFKTSGNGKIFAIAALADEPLRISVKIDPEDSLALQAEFAAITPGYHLNKKHWITVVVDGIPEELLEQLITDSHSLVKPRVRRGSGGQVGTAGD
jgi:predicted DNA-binding protein (MmcQ/YjbR family)